MYVSFISLSEMLTNLLPYSASTAALIRIAYIPTMLSHGLLWASAPFMQWTTVELGLAIIAGCLATLRPLIDRVMAKLGLHSERSVPSGPSDIATPHWNMPFLKSKTNSVQAHELGNYRPSEGPFDGSNASR